MNDIYKLTKVASTISEHKKDLTINEMAKYTNMNETRQDINVIPVHNTLTAVLTVTE